VARGRNDAIASDHCQRVCFVHAGELLQVRLTHGHTGRFDTERSGVLLLEPERVDTRMDSPVVLGVLQKALEVRRVDFLRFGSLLLQLHQRVVDALKGEFVE
jgi:hypothetical protein